MKVKATQASRRNLLSPDPLALTSRNKKATVRGGFFVSSGAVHAMVFGVLLAA
jgi:hypothetical protein